jgi:2-phospho-L-lactate guanylyltransferase (CobY/MobA/RfbA family)
VGFSVVIGEDSEISTAFTHALENTATGTLSPFVGGGTNSLTMDQNEFEVSYSKKF